MSIYLLSAWLISAAYGANIVDRVAAVVNDEVIALSEVYDLGKDFVSSRCPTSAPACQTEAELEVLDEIIKRVLVRQELNRLGMRVTGTEIDQAIDQIVADNTLSDRDQLRREVERTGLSWEAYREQLLEQLQMQRFQQAIIGPRISVAEDEVRDLYQRTVRDVEGELEVK
ncbi:MAG: hypothetical protein HN348_17535, partial [Proteobacteria bacterium]|nr:hypothetical protein [Pseudomonadota bacterium]